MKYIKFFMIVMAGIAVLSLIWTAMKFYAKPTTVNNNAPINESLANPEDSFESKIDATGPVSIEVTPQNISETQESWKFSVSLNTHSWELREDIQKSAKLIDDNGKEYEAIAWDGTGPGGHHRNGTLVFKSISPMPKAIELRIENIGGIPKRNFLWKLP